MLDILRRKAQSPFIQTLVLIIVIVFVFWGVGSSFLDNRTAAAVVNGEEISLQDYQRAYDNLVDNYRQQLGGAIPPGFLEQLGVKDQVLRQLIQAALMRQGARNMGLMVSAVEVQKEIETMGVFQKEGRFNLDLYKDVLEQNRMTPASFEDSLRTDLNSRLVIGAVERFAVVTDAEVLQLKAHDDEEIRLAYIAFKSEDFKGQVESSDEALQKYFDANKNRYLTEKKTRLSYLAFDADEVDGAATQEEDAASGEKAAEKREQRLKEGKDKVLPLAEDAYKGIMAAGSLSAYGEKSGQKVAATELFPRSVPPAGITADPRFLQVAFELKQGELSSLVETARGYAILFVEEVKEPEVPPLAEVRTRLETDFRRDEAQRLAREAADKLLKQAGESGDLIAAAEQTGLSPSRSEFVQRGAQGGEQGPPSQVINAAFALALASPLPKETLALGSTFYVFALMERRSPEVKLEENERKELRQRLLDTKKTMLVSAWIKSLENTAKIITNTQFL